MAQKKQETLSLFKDAFDLTRDLTDQQFGQLMRAIGAYRFDGISYTGTDPSVKMAYGFIVSQVDRYGEYCQKKRDAVNNRYRERRAHTEEYKEVQKGTTGPSISISMSDIDNKPANGLKAISPEEREFNTDWVKEDLAIAR